MAGTYKEDPEKVMKVLETIIENHEPDWQDLQVKLGTLLTYEKHYTVLAKEEAE